MLVIGAEAQTFRGSCAREPPDGRARLRSSWHRTTARSPGGTRGGFRAEFVNRIRRCEYPQYLWDKLPLEGTSESILRLDHLQPIGRHPNAYEHTSHCLGAPAVRILDDWLTWLLTGTLPPDGDLGFVRGELLKLSSPRESVGR